MLPASSLFQVSVVKLVVHNMENPSPLDKGWFIPQSIPFSAWVYFSTWISQTIRISSKGLIQGHQCWHFATQVLQNNPEKWVGAVGWNLGPPRLSEEAQGDAFPYFLIPPVPLVAYTKIFLVSFAVSFLAVNIDSLTAIIQGQILLVKVS